METFKNIVATVVILVGIIAIPVLTMLAFVLNWVLEVKILLVFMMILDTILIYTFIYYNIVQGE